MCLKVKQPRTAEPAEFQIEPTRFISGISQDRHQLSSWFGGDQARPAIESLLLAIRFRNYLSTNEKELLDLLAPERTITFLIRHRQYLHPEGVHLFPLEMLNNLHATRGDAIFTQRYRPTVSADVDCCRLQAAKIGEWHHEPLVLGMLGPEPSLDDSEREHCFAQMVAQFCSAWKATADIYASIAEKYSPDCPCMIINRTAGRPLAVNRLLMDLMNANERDLTDREYSQLADKLTGSISARRLTLENLSTGEMELCVASIHSEKQSGEQPEEDTLPAVLVPRAVRHKLSAITAAASHLQNLGDCTDTNNIHELSGIILDEATQADRHLNQLELLASSDCFHTKPTKTAEDLQIPGGIR